MPADFMNRIADASDAELAAVTRTLIQLPEVETNDEERFFGQVKALVEDRAHRLWPGESASEVAIFVRVDYPRLAADTLVCPKPSADMIGTVEPLMGRVFLLDRNASQGWSADLPTADPGELLEWLNSSLLGSNQIIFVYRKNHLMIERANGAGQSPTRQEKIRTQPAPVTPQGLIAALDVFHKTHVLTPHNCPEGVWRTGHAELYHVGPTPELSLQAILRTFLTAWFRGQLRVEREISTEIGRIDIGLLYPPIDPKDGLTYWGVVELKVIKSFRYSSNGKKPNKVGPLPNARDVAKGVQQAYAFRVNRGCTCAILEIYDMRADKTVDPRQHSEVKKVLSACSPAPLMRLMPLFGSAQQARQAGFFPKP